MTEDNARRIANCIMGATALGVALYVVKTPSLRRAVGRLAVITITRALPAWFAREVRTAWAASGSRGI